VTLSCSASLSFLYYQVSMLYEFPVQHWLISQTPSVGINWTLPMHAIWSMYTFYIIFIVLMNTCELVLNLNCSLELNFVDSISKSSLTANCSLTPTHILTEDDEDIWRSFVHRLLLWVGLLQCNLTFKCVVQ